MNYRILSTYSSEELESLVNEMIQDGWRPLGSVAVSFCEYQYESPRDGLTTSREEIWTQAIIEE